MFYQVKLLIFYNIQTVNVTFVELSIVRAVDESFLNLRMELQKNFKLKLSAPALA